MSRVCAVCGSCRPNEAFRGRGPRVCRRCRQSLGNEACGRILLLQEVVGFLEQSNISKKNLRRLRELAGSEDSQVRSEAELVLDVALVAPRRRRRRRVLAERRPDLLRRVEHHLGPVEIPVPLDDCEEPWLKEDLRELASFWAGGELAQPGDRWIEEELESPVPDGSPSARPLTARAPAGAPGSPRPWSRRSDC